MPTATSTATATVNGIDNIAVLNDAADVGGTEEQQNSTANVDEAKTHTKPNANVQITNSYFDWLDDKTLQHVFGAFIVHFFRK